VDIKQIPLYFAVFVSGWLAYEYCSVIFVTGGVGKNGSTVAVRTFRFKIYYKFSSVYSKK
jgi:hypothetical protein